MTTWRYAVTRGTEYEPGGQECDSYAIREVYFDGNKVAGWTAHPTTLRAESIEDLGAEVGRIVEALRRPVIDLRGLDE